MESDVDSQPVYLIRKHDWVPDVTRTFEHCSICHQVIGQGMWDVSPCELRFDETRFKKWLDFKGYSRIDSTSKVTRYCKRYTDDIFTEKFLLKSYKKLK